MNVKEAINKRRAYRSIEARPLEKSELRALESAVQLAPSCYNNQPWRYIFVTDNEKKEEMKTVLSKGNEWANHASLYIAVCARKQDDCVIYDREYYLFDTGLATGFLILQATELDLVAHPIAGYSPKKTRKILSIPDDMQVIALIIVGKHKEPLRNSLSEKQQQTELNRPERKPVNKIVFYDCYKG